MPSTYRAWCQCGCGNRVNTPNARFLPYHAQTMRSVLMAQVRAGSIYAEQEMRVLGWQPPAPIVAPAVARLKPNAGIEAEFYGVDRSTAIHALRRHGLDADDDGYHHHARPYWRVTSDSSVSQDGNELVSPILRSDRVKDETDIRAAFTAIAGTGAVIDQSCGLHVHHDAAGMSVPEIAQVVAHYAVFQPVIGELIPYDRIRNSFCREIGNPDRRYASILEYDSTTRLGNNAARYEAVNLQALVDHGTVEFRQHQATLKAEKAIQWMQLTKLLMRAGKTKDYREARALGADVLTMEGMCKYLGAGKPLTAALVARANVTDDDDYMAMSEPPDDMWCDYCDSSSHWQDDCTYCGECGCDPCDCGDPEGW